jgi:hypothetical protein
MASALDTIAHVVLPNVMKLKGGATVVNAIERKDVSIFASVWTQTGVAHTPQALMKEKSDVYRIGVLSLPKPNEMGEAYMVAFVAKKNDASVARYFTLEHDYVLATKVTKTLIREKDGQNYMKRGGDGPPITGDFVADANAFADAIDVIMNPPITIDKDRAYGK